MTRPLDGLTILETGQGISAAYCALLMGALGADVIKVEPLGGDETRRLGPFPEDIPDRERSALFLTLNRNKRSIAIDLDTATGQELFRQLARHAGLVVENHAPGYMAARHIGYQDLAGDLPALVWTAITPFGQDGPYRDYAATEVTLFALGGMMNLVGDIEREPLMFGGRPSLHSAGVYGFSAAMIALEMAETCGTGQFVDVAVFEGLAASHFQALVDYEYRGLVRRRTEVRMPIPTLDGFISFTVQAHQYQDFQRLILGERAVKEGQVDDAVARDRNRTEGEMDTEILVWSVQQTKYDAYRAAQSARVPAAFIADARDLLGSPQYQARDYFVTLDHPDAGPLIYPGFPAKFDGAAWEWAAAPRLSQHADEILLGLTDLSADEVAEVKAAGVVR
ncbi:MAG: CoA transferase [Dehalococcoidia bacterium]|nr:MAG: CoA transferase [Dehalococcoidia bacterium]